MDEVTQNSTQQKPVEDAPMQGAVEMLGRVQLGIDESRFPPAVNIGPGAYWVKARRPMPNHPFANAWHVAHIYEWDGKLIHMECGSIMIEVLSPQFCALFDWVAIEAPGEIVTKVPKDMIRINAMPMPVAPEPASPMDISVEPEATEQVPTALVDTPNDNIVSFPGK